MPQPKPAPRTVLSKRDPLKEIKSGAARAADNRDKEREATGRLRTSLGNPTDSHGKPVTTITLLELASQRPLGVSGNTDQSIFEHCTMRFLDGLRFSKHSDLSVQEVWVRFLEAIERADAARATFLASQFRDAFRWSLVAHVRHLQWVHQQEPDAVVTVEIWSAAEEPKRTVLIGVRRNGDKILLPDDDHSLLPTVVFAGQRISERTPIERSPIVIPDGFVGWDGLQAEVGATAQKQRTLWEDTALNVGWVEDDELDSVVASVEELARFYRMRPGPTGRDSPVT